MKFLTTLVLSCFVALSFAQNAYEIQVNIKDYTEDELYLAYYLGDKQYIQDTVVRAADGSYTFRGEEALKPGVYLVVTTPDNDFFQFLITAEEQQFEVSTEMGEQQVASTAFRESPENTLFYNYLNFLNDMRPRGEAIQAKMEEADEAEKAKLQAELDGLSDEVLQYQQQLIAEHPASLTAAIIKANLPADMPEFTGTEQEVNTKRWRWTQHHFFDNIDLSDGRLLRSPFLFSKVDYYVQKLQVQHPDTISEAVNYVLQRMLPSEDLFQYYLIHFLNFYAGSKYVGMDAVYVDLVDNYYAKGLAPWTEEEQLNKIIDNANRLRPLLIGKTAPNIQMQRRDGTPVALHDVETPYTVLYFWRYDCGHCKESTPDMKAFQEEFADKGVTLFAVCAKLRDEVPECWEYIDENDIGDWLHVVDPYGRSRYMSIYDLRSTPQIYILDSEHKIISKRLGAEQLSDFMNRVLEEDAQRRQEEMLDGSGQK
jgi:thiol-disulfide isomerase/thioredoxin